MRTVEKMLLVDDDLVTNFINKRLIDKLKIANEVIIAVNGEEGINCLYDQCLKFQKSPEIILLDINMPVMDGFEVLKAFNALSFNNKDEVSIAILSTSTHTADKEKMKELGATHFIIKPLTKEKIEDLLTK